MFNVIESLRMMMIELIIEFGRWEGGRGKVIFV